MGWIGLNDLDIAAFDPTGISAQSSTLFPEDIAIREDDILAIGTLLIEVLFVARARQPQRVLRYERRDGWLRAMSVLITADGCLTLEVCQGGAVSRASLNFPAPPTDTRLRISYGWDAPGRRAVLTVEDLDQELLYQAEATSPLPLPLVDAREIILNGSKTRIGPETRFLALSDRFEPVGLTTGVVKGTPIETVDGPKFVERLRLGDQVVTSTGIPRQVRWIAQRQVPALGRFRPVRLRAPYFGLTRDVLVAADTRIMVTGAEAEYLFGEAHVLVEAHHMIDGNSVRREPPDAAILSYYHVLLDGHECLKYAGLWGESLFVGAIGRSAEMIATTALADMPFEAIPRHTRFALPILSGLEARTLVQSLSA